MWTVCSEPNKELDRVQTTFPVATTILFFSKNKCHMSYVINNNNNKKKNHILVGSGDTTIIRILPESCICWMLFLIFFIDNLGDCVFLIL